jgi:rhodanese-related sulfurtransferase
MSTSFRKDGFSGYIVVLFISIGLFILLQERNSGVKSITVDEAGQLMNRDTAVVLLDVRTNDEWNSPTGHLKNAILIPLQDLRDKINILDSFRSRQIIVYCRSGNRSGRATRILADSGFNAVNLAGGIRAWNSRMYPVQQEKSE